MAEHPTTVKVVSDNPAHEQGYVIKNADALAEGDVLFTEKAVKAKPAEKAADKKEEVDNFDDMDADELRAYLVEHGKTPHHALGEAKLRAACRELAEGLV